MESEKEQYVPKIEIRHYRYVDPFWRTNVLQGILCAAKGMADAPTTGLCNQARETICGFMDLLDDPDVLLTERAVPLITEEGGQCPGQLVPTGPFLYSRGTHDEDGQKVRNTHWAPAPVGGLTVAAVLIDGVSYCVLEPCVAPDTYSYKRGRQIAEGRLRKRLAEMGVVLPK
jgi:hypothetical protein